MRAKNQIKTLALMLALAATATSTALAKPITDPRPLLPAATNFVASPSPDAVDAARFTQSNVSSLPVAQPSPDAADVAAHRYPGNGIIATTAAPQIVRVSDHSGFDWGDAGVGAAAALGLSLFAAACGLNGSRRRQRRIDASAPVTG
jgi:hypothetical protein